MAESLSVKIALEGGAEIERQLADIGAAGQKAFGAIAQSAEQVGGFKNIKPEEVTAKLKDLGITGVESINKIQAAVRSAGRLEGLVQGIETAQAAFAGLARAAGVVGVAVGAGMVALSKQTIGFAQAINKTSAEAIKLGLSFRELDQAKLRMEQTGMSATAISSGIAAIKGNLDKLEVSKLKKLAEEMAKLQSLGVRFAPGQGPDALKQFEEAAKKIGPAGDFAREALRRLAVEAQKSSNVRFLPGVVPTLEQLKANADPVIAGFNKLGIAATHVGEQSGLVTQKLSEMTDVAERNRLALLLMGEAAGTAFIQAQGSGNAAEDAANRLVEALNRLKAAWDRFGSVSFAPVITTQINTVTTALQELQRMVEGLSWQSFADGILAVGRALNDLSFGRQVLNGIAVLFPQITGVIERAIDALRRFLALQSSASTPSLSDTGNVSGMAGGGLLGGRGTGTSDSNLAWLSRGEYVTPAHAVAQPGVLAFLEALRRSGGNLSRVLNGMGRFAAGGFVMPRAIPAYAAGGLAGSSRNLGTLTLRLPDGTSVSGLTDAKIAEALGRVAVQNQVRSGGRKPSRYS